MIRNIPEFLSRLTIGIVFMQSGWGKFQNMPGVVDYFASLGIPFPALQAPFVSGVELVCGLFILVGFFTRLSTLPLMATMIVALITAKAEDIGSVSDLLGLSEFLYIVILVGLAVHGSKSISVDQWRCRRSKGDSCKRETAP